MKHQRFLTGLFLLATCFLSKSLTAQEERALTGAKFLRITSAHTAFPDTGRNRGYTYNEKYYAFRDHYQDSGVIIIVPENPPKRHLVELIFWFHGWNNNIDTALVYYHIGEQFISAHRNAVLVLAETAKNAPDSYGGKLEQPGVFSALVQDVMNSLKKSRLVPKNALPGKVMLAGHSVAYKVIAMILQNGDVKIQEVELFDALYGQTDKFANWIGLSNRNRFINLFTNQGGGTDEVSKDDGKFN